MVNRELQQILQERNREWALNNPDFLSRLFQKVVSDLEPATKSLIEGSSAHICVDDSGLLVIVDLIEPHITTYANRPKVAAVAEPLAVALGIYRLGIRYGYEIWAAIRMPQGGWVVVSEQEFLGHPYGV